MLTDTIQVATMTQTGFCAILHIVAHTLYLLGMVGALRKAVGHQHIEHIGIGKAHTLVAAHLALLELVLHLGLTEVQCHDAWLCTAQVHVDEQIVGRVEAHQTIDNHARVIGCNTCNIADTFSVHHQLHLRILHAYIPVGGFDTVNNGLFCCTH